MSRKETEAEKSVAEKWKKVTKAKEVYDHIPAADETPPAKPDTSIPPGKPGRGRG